MTTKLAAEFLGTFWLVLGGCGSAVLAATFPGVGISGGHFNPAVSVGLCAGGRFPAAHLFPYVVAQTLGAIVAAGVLYLIASGSHGFDLAAGFAPTGMATTRPASTL
jgi:aquaporin Z